MLTDDGDPWTAGQRVNLTNSPSSFIWRLETANYYTKLPINVDFWSPGEPNNRDGFCVAMYKHNSYFWIDTACSFLNNFVCEIDIA